MKHFQIIHDYAALRTHEVQYHTDISFFFKVFYSLTDQKILKLLFLYENNKADLKAYRFVNFFMCHLLVISQLFCG